jgi:hypothetical protein
MIDSLDDAWNWYAAVKTLAQDMRRFAKLWDDPRLAEALGRDNNLRDRTSVDIVDMTTTVLDELDVLSVLVMFSVFEATVRSRASADVEKETGSIRHPAVLHALSELKDAVENGSFGRVTEAYKKMDPNLTTQVNQVRKFRNWVAHGRRGKPENNVNPDTARDRLGRYLDRLQEVESAG